MNFELVAISALTVYAITITLALRRERGRSRAFETESAVIRKDNDTLRGALSGANSDNMALQEKVMEITRDLPARRELDRDLVMLRREIDRQAHLRRLGMVCRTILQREDDFAAGTRKVGSGLEKDLVDQIRKVVDQAGRDASTAAG